MSQDLTGQNFTGTDFVAGIERAAKKALEITDTLNELDGAMGEDRKSVV